MARARKVHKQLELPKLDKNGQRRGGKRKGAGRPPKGPRSSERHKIRASFTRHQPIHVVLRPIEQVGSLRKRQIYKALYAAMVATYVRPRMRIIHLSIQGTHIHMLVEAPNRRALARGMQGFEIAAAKNINAVLSKRLGHRRRGTVFPDRYHAVIIKNPRQARGALAYVLNNWRRHGEHETKVARGWAIDPFSSAPSFDGFKDLDPRANDWGENYLRLPVFAPRTWLLATGWRMYGLISTTEVPGKPWTPNVVRDGNRRMRAEPRQSALTATA